MDEGPQIRCTAFEGHRRITSGSLQEVVLALKEAEGRSVGGPILVFDDATGKVLDLDLRGTPDEVRARLADHAAVVASAEAAVPEPAPQRGRGRPRLGVVAKEVTLLPRHWAWLGGQPGGASATLRRLVDQARKAGEHRDRVRTAQDAAYRFMSATGGDLPGFEEAIRALFAADRARFTAEIHGWPEDLRDHSTRLAADAFRAASPPGAADPVHVAP